MSQISFQYTAVDDAGKRTRGIMQALDQSEAFRKITAAGLHPLKIKSSRRKHGKKRKVSLKDLSQFTYQFSVLMEARIPIVEGLRSIVEQESNVTLRTAVEEVADHIEAGNNVTEALEKHGELFGEMYIETIRAAESSGNMVEVLSRLSEMLDRQYEINKDVKGALIYPAVVVSTLSFAVIFLVVFVVPRFAEMFESKGLELPLPTQLLIWISDFIRSFWPFLLGGGFVAVKGIQAAWRRPASREKMDGWMHHLPYISDILRGLAISRFAHVLNVSLRSGLNILDSLHMAGRASGRPLLELDTDKLQNQVKRGGRLSDVLLTCTYFPPFTRRMMAAGEDAAELPRMCEIISSHYDREVGYLTKNIATIIEPLMIVGLAGVVLIIALAIFLPMWDMGKLVG